jgi:hypothetical protein
LYDKHCSGCHLPALTPAITHGQEPNAEFWKHFEPFHWSDGGKDKQTKESLLTLNMIPQEHIGTDPAQGAVLENRRVNTAGTDLAQEGKFSPGLGIDIDVCVFKNKRWETTHISDDSMQLYPLALGAVVQMSIDEGFRVPPADDAARARIEGDRPNCLGAAGGYKARPLNGVWATAPFLHNGSVPTLYDLLSPVADRPKAFLLGDPSFDAQRVGIVTHPVEPKGRTYDENGYFILDTSTPGNHNTGHEFSNDKREGVIGPALSPEERNAIIEFLKTI